MFTLAAQTLSYLQAIVIGILQGITELFPISSLGHSVLVPELLGWHSLVAGESADESFYLAFLVGLHVATAIALLVPATALGTTPSPGKGGFSKRRSTRGRGRSAAWKCRGSSCRGTTALASMRNHAQSQASGQSSPFQSVFIQQMPASSTLRAYVRPCS